MCLRGLRLNDCTSVRGGMTTTHTNHARMNINCEEFVTSRNTRGNKRRGNISVNSEVPEMGKQRKAGLRVSRQLHKAKQQSKNECANDMPSY